MNPLNGYETDTQEPHALQGVNDLEALQARINAWEEFVCICYSKKDSVNFGETLEGLKANMNFLQDCRRKMDIARQWVHNGGPKPDFM